MVRQKVRYLLVQFDDLKCPKSTASKFTAKELLGVLVENCSYNFGEVSAAHLFDRCYVRYFDPTASPPFAVVRCARDQADIVRATLTLITSLRDVRCSIRVVSVSGSPRTAKLSFIKYFRSRVPNTKTNDTAYCEEFRKTVRQVLIGLD